MKSRADVKAMAWEAWEEVRRDLASRSGLDVFGDIEEEIADDISETEATIFAAAMIAVQDNALEAAARLATAEHLSVTDGLAERIRSLKETP